MTPANSVTISPNPFKILRNVALVSVATTAATAVLVVFLGFFTVPWFLSHFWTIMNCTAALLVGYCGLATFGAMIWSRPRVEIGPEGFVIQGTVGRRARYWRDIDGSFTVVRKGLQAAVAYRLTGVFKEAARMKPGPSLAGNDEVILICGELEIGAGKLAEVLNQWKQSGS
jgi:hypothetical protein